jgi:hypothetical protein
MFGDSSALVGPRVMRRGLMRADGNANYTYRDLSLTLADSETMTRPPVLRRHDHSSLKIGLEFVKMHRHCHPRVNRNLHYTYPEMCEVLEGDARYLLQRAERR